jgi:hypothetical protein
VSDKWKPRAEYAKERERADVSARKEKQDQTHDPVIEQAVVAFVNYRQNGGDMKWEQFRRQWYLDHEKKEAASGS